jgi:hypothetical protein
MVWTVAQVGDFTSMVTRGKCGKFKKKHLSLLLGKKNGNEKGRLLGLGTKSNGLPLVKAKETGN